MFRVTTPQGINSLTIDALRRNDRPSNAILVHLKPDLSKDLTFDNPDLISCRPNCWWTKYWVTEERKINCDIHFLFTSIGFIDSVQSSGWVGNDCWVHMRHLYVPGYALDICVQYSFLFPFQQKERNRKISYYSGNHVIFRIYLSPKCYKVFGIELFYNFILSFNRNKWKHSSGWFFLLLFCFL